MQVPNQFDVNAPINVGSVLQVFKNATDADVGLPTTVGASATINSLFIRSEGYKTIAIGLTSTQDATISVQRYVDQEGQIPQDDGNPFKRDITANEPTSLNILDGKPFGSFKISITNKSASTMATINPFLLILQAN